MALKATIIKVTLHVSDTDNHRYLSQTLTIAQHPSETLQRVVVRLIAWALNAHEDLTFTKGLCADDEPELWRKHLHGDIAEWIEVGLPDERRLKKASNRADHVTLYTYGERNAALWWSQNEKALSQLKNLSVFDLDDQSFQPLVDNFGRTAEWQVTISDQIIYISSDQVDISFSTSTRQHDSE